MSESRKKVSLSDIGGFKEEKQEAKRIINFLKNFDEYTAKGAYLPKGMMLLGDPGLGKTLLATAIADESGIPMFTIQGEGDCLVGDKLLATIGQAFEKAKKNVPCVLILDDIANFIPDGSRFGGSDRGNDILNYILTQIDGISKSDGIYIIATANSRFDIPDALVRSGRLENVITLNYPDLKEREEICKIYLKSSPLLEEVNPNELAIRVGQVTGAMIKRIINDGLIYALGENKKMHARDFMPFVFSCTMEGIKKEGKEADDHPTAIHELGHFLADNVLNGTVGDIIIEKYSSARGAYRRRKNDKEAENWSMKRCFNEAVIGLAGLAATEVILGERHMGAYDDVKKTVSLFVKMNSSGMFGFNCFSTDVATSYSAPEFGPSPNFHPVMSAFLDATYNTAKDIILKNVEFIDIVSKQLEKRKVILASEMDEIIKEYPINKEIKIHEMEVKEGGDELPETARRNKLTAKAMISLEKMGVDVR